MPTRPLQVPWVGRALKSQGQPNAQLQFFTHSPERRQSVPAIALLPCKIILPLGIVISTIRSLAGRWQRALGPDRPPRPKAATTRFRKPEEAV
jgi:hypothetical protein